MPFTGPFKGPLHDLYRPIDALYRFFTGPLQDLCRPNAGQAQAEADQACRLSSNARKSAERSVRMLKLLPDASQAEMGTAADVLRCPLENIPPIIPLTTNIIHEYIYTCIYLYICICMYIYIDTCIHINICTYAYIPT